MSNIDYIEDYIEDYVMIDSNKSESSINSFIYTLQLEKGKYYVGFTERKDGERFNEHFAGEGSKWTKIYKPIQVLEWRRGTLEDEDRVTLEMMEKYGWWNVRGLRSCKDPEWCNVIMETPPNELVKKPDASMFTKVTGFLSYLLSDSSVVTYKPKKSYTTDRHDKHSTASKKLVCYRCGRNTHLADRCYAKTHLNGKHL